MNKKRHKGLFVSILLATIILVAFGSTFFIYRNGKSEKASHEITVVTSFYPMYIATMNVTDGVDGINLKSLSEPETGCLHDYQLTPEDMKLLSTADVFIVNGGGIEEFLTDVASAYPDLKILDASEGIETIEDNGHIWMSPRLHKKQVANIAKGMAEFDDAHAHKYLHNAEHYGEHLDELIYAMEDLQGRMTGKDVILFHEAYAYMAQDLGMNVSYVLDLDEERQVSAGEVSDVMSAISEIQVDLVLAEETYGSEMGNMVEEETSAKVIYLDTLVRGKYDKNSYLEKMFENVDKLYMYNGTIVDRAHGHSTETE